MQAEEFIKLAKKNQERMIQDRRYLHEHPELSQHEENTVRFVADRLKELHIEYTIVPKGGVLGFIGGSEQDTDKKTVLLRADMDALPVEESPDNLRQPKCCVSQVKGVSHACGHDAHTAMLLSAAEILKEKEDQLPGRVILFFERAEEAGGNILFLLRYIYEHKIRVDGCYGTHVRAELESGTVSVDPGPISAGGFGFECTIHGQGGHGAHPSRANSPVDCFVALYQACCLIPVKYIPADEALSFSLGKVQAGSKRNIIPSDLEFAGSFRFFDHKIGVAAKKKFLELCNSICEAYGCQFELTKEVGPTLPLVNEPHCTELCGKVVEEVVGEANRVHERPGMGSESFSAAQRIWPGTFTHLGIRNPELGSGAGHHSPEFDLDESVLYIGAGLYAAYAFAFLEDDTPIEFETYPGSPDDLYKEICYTVTG